MATLTEAREEGSSAYAYYVLFILALVYLFSSIDRTLISVLAEPIKRDFGLSDGQLGLLTGLAFAISYSLAGIPLVCRHLREAAGDQLHEPYRVRGQGTRRDNPEQSKALIARRIKDGNQVRRVFPVGLGGLYGSNRQQLGMRDVLEHQPHRCHLREAFQNLARLHEVVRAERDQREPQRREPQCRRPNREQASDEGGQGQTHDEEDRARGHFNQISLATGTAGASSRVSPGHGANVQPFHIQRSAFGKSSLEACPPWSPGPMTSR